MIGAGEQARRRTMLAQLVREFPVDRGNWEVDCPELVGGVLTMVSGQVPVPGRYAAVATDQTYTFITVTETEAEALELLAEGSSDAEHPRRPVALADLLEGSIYEVGVTVTRSTSPRAIGRELARC